MCYEIGSSEGSELHESVVCGYMLSMSSLLGLVPREASACHQWIPIPCTPSHFGDETVSQHRRYLGFTLPHPSTRRLGFTMQEDLPKVSTFPTLHKRVGPGQDSF